MIVIAICGLSVLAIYAYAAWAAEAGEAAAAAESAAAADASAGLLAPETGMLTASTAAESAAAADASAGLVPADTGITSSFPELQTIPQPGLDTPIATTQPMQPAHVLGQAPATEPPVTFNPAPESPIQPSDPVLPSGPTDTVYTPESTGPTTSPQPAPSPAPPAATEGSVYSSAVSRAIQTAASKGVQVLVKDLTGATAGTPPGALSAQPAAELPPWAPVAAVIGLFLILR